MRTLLATRIMHHRFFALVMAGLLLLTTFSVAAGSGEKFIQTPDRSTSDAKAMNIFANLQYNGMSLDFYEVRSPDGEVGGVAVAQHVRSGYRGIEAIPRLRSANALEVYNAMSEPGTRLPRELVRLYDQPVLGQQGWGRDLPLAEPSDPQALSCMVGSESFNSVKNEVESFGMPFVFLSEADGPSTKPNHWSDDNGPADGTIRRKLQGGVNSKEHFFGKVSYCFEDHDGYPLAFHGRFVSFDLRISGFAVWQTETTQLFEPGDSASLHFSAAPNSIYDFDFKLRISAARPLDQFHIGATWSDPDETLVFKD